MLAFHKRDKNEKVIIAALVAIGARVTKIQGCFGGDGDFGVPDLLVGYRGRTLLIEVKEPDTHQKTKRGKGGAEVPENAKGQLTPTQVSWWSKWTGGEAYVVETPEQAVALVRGSDIPPNIMISASPRNVIDTTDGCSVVIVDHDLYTTKRVSPAQADALAGALHEQAGVARALAAADKRDTKPQTSNGGPTT